jgi:hypothetical protein
MMVVYVASASHFVILFFLDNKFRVLPTALHDYLPAHHPGLVITDITVTQCSKISFLTSCKLDSAVWHRIDKNLYLKSGWISSAYVDIQRKKEEELTPDDKVIIDVSVGRRDPSAGGKDNTRGEVT